MSVETGEMEVVLVNVVKNVAPDKVLVMIFDVLVRVTFMVSVVVPAARASRPRINRRAAGVGLQVTVVFFTVVLREVV